MGNLFKKGTPATRRFAVEAVPAGREERFVRGVRAHAFMAIDPVSAEDTSFGWVAPLDDDDVDLTTRKIWHAGANGTELRLGIRTDTLKPPADEVKRQVAQRTAQIEADEGRKLSRRERKGLKEEVTRQLRQRAFPRRNVVQVVWRTEEGRLYLSSPSKKGVERFLDLFAKSFGLKIEEEGAARWAHEAVPAETLKSLEPTRELWMGFAGVRPLSADVSEQEGA
jgi:recombination associated protein RdgC